MRTHAIAIMYFLLATPGFATITGPSYKSYKITDIACAETHGFAVSVRVDKDAPYPTDTWVVLPESVNEKPFLATAFAIDYDGQYLYAKLEKDNARPRQGTLQFSAEGSKKIILSGRFIVSYEDQGFMIHLGPLYKSILERGHASDYGTKYERNAASIESLEGCGAET